MSAAETPPMSADRSEPGQLLPASLVFADTPSRIVAYFLDGLLVAAMAAVPLTFTLSDFSYLRFPDRNLYALATVVGMAAQVLYFIWFWSGGRRATPGQRVFGIQVGTAFDGNPLSTRQAVLRYLGTGLWLGFPFALPFRGLAFLALVISPVWLLVLLVSVVASPTRQGLHDRFAGSALVRPAGADRRWALAVIGIVVAFALLEAFLLAVVFLGPIRDYMPAEYWAFWQRYLDWLWPL